MPRRGGLPGVVSFLLIAAWFVSTVFAGSIEVNVAEVIKSEAKELEHATDNNLLEISYDVLNSGSAGYGARMRLDVFNGTEKLTTLWSREEALIPGERKTINMYWYEPKENGTYTFRARIYRAYETEDIGNFTEESKNINASETIEIDRIHVYDNEIRFRIRSSTDLESVIVYPGEHPEGWIFEEGTVDGLKAGRAKAASIRYETGLFSPKKVTLVAVSTDGRDYGTKTFELAEEKGFTKWLDEFRDWLDI
ncbi:Uncharacterised protein [uncultured archaeon]|nr:Uncharacterised protein [uncultured archaeon]